MSFAEWLQSRLDKLEWKAIRLSEESGIKRGTISKWLRSQSIPSPENCEKIAIAMRVPVEDVYKAAGHPIAESVAMKQCNGHVLTSDDLRALEVFRRIPPAKRERVLDLIGVLSD